MSFEEELDLLIEQWMAAINNGDSMTEKEAFKNIMELLHTHFGFKNIKEQ